jgi:ubiquitin-protein ligase E3 C
LPQHCCTAAAAAAAAAAFPPFCAQSNLFSENPQRQLYPNPAAYQLVPDAEGQLRFLGRMLGKSLYEGMLLELPLAAFFLKKMRGGVCDINDLPSLDPEVYRHLAQLKHYNGELSSRIMRSFCLSYTSKLA